MFLRFLPFPFVFANIYLFIYLQGMTGLEGEILFGRKLDFLSRFAYARLEESLEGR